MESGSASPLRLWAVLYNEETPGGASRIQTRSDRKTSPSQQPPLLSPSLSVLWRGHFHSAFSPQASAGLRAMRLPPGWKCQCVWKTAVLQPFWMEEHEGRRLSPRHVKPQNTEGGTVLCFCSCLGFDNWLCLHCSLQALASGHSSTGWGSGESGERGCLCLWGFSAETCLHQNSLTLTPAYYQGLWAGFMWYSRNFTIRNLITQSLLCCW